MHIQALTFEQLLAQEKEDTWSGDHRYKKVLICKDCSHSLRLGMGFDMLISGLVWEAYFVQTGVIDLSEFCSTWTKDTILIGGLVFALGLACVGVAMCNKWWKGDAASDAAGGHADAARHPHAGAGDGRSCGAGALLNTHGRRVTQHYTQSTC